jgi:ADP-heptose:LPS heptosyltransferase
VAASAKPIAMPRRLGFLQSLDRRFGPALVRRMVPRARALATSRERGAPLPAGAVRRLLVIRPGGLGDAILMWPMLEVLRAAFPQARLDVLAERRNAGAFGISEPAANVIRYDRSPLRMLAELRRNDYDLVVDTEQYHHLSVLLANALRPRWLCGFDTLGRGRFQTHPVPHAEDVYEALSFLRLAEAVTGQRPAFDAERPFITVSGAALAWADEALHTAGGASVVAIMPAAGGSYRLWAPERFAEVARWLIARGHHVVVLAGGDGAEAAQLIAAAAASPMLSNLAGRTTLAQTAAVLSRCRLAISTDTGVLHVAYAVGTPTVSLFGPGLYRKWAPPGRAHRLVRRGLACSPCIRYGVLPLCPYDVACMREITVAGVIGAVEELLQ